MYVIGMVAYTGKAVTPFNDKIRLSDGRAVLYGVDYTVEYTNNINIGTATAVINFKGNYQGSVTKKFNIVDGKTILRGDVNGDGEVNVTDVVLVAAHVKNIKALDSASQKRADVNYDGDINVTDIIKIAAHVKGLKSLNS